jgi:hypothetical protein
MTFKSDRQRKAVMAKLNQGSVRSDVKPVLQPTGKNKMVRKAKVKLTKVRGKMQVKITGWGLPPTFKNINQEEYRVLKMQRRKARKK